MGVEFDTRACRQLATRRRIEQVHAVRIKPCCVAFDNPRHRRPATVITPALRRCMELADGRRKRWHQFESQATIRSQAVEERLLREPMHLDHPIDGGAGTTERDRSVSLTRYRYDCAIKSRCSASIQMHLCVAHRSTAFGGREIEILEPHGAFQLVGALAGEKDDGAMRVDPLDSGAAVSRRRSKEVDNCGL